MVTEADTCRTLVLPMIYDAGWTDEQIEEQRAFTDGRIVLVGDKPRRRNGKRADYILRYRRNFSLAVVEAKAQHLAAEDGLQQAIEYAAMLSVPFAYSTNGRGVVEHDFLSGKESRLSRIPGPDELWQRYAAAKSLTDTAARRVTYPCSNESGRVPRYYQESAINRAIEAVSAGKKRVLLTLATGTGKTVVAFQICWKLWNSYWNRTGARRRPRMLYLADRAVLVDDPKDKQFADFGDARHRIQGEAVLSRQMYFSTYQALAADDSRSGLYQDYPSDFFDLIIVDECHRGSASEGNWREILEYFSPAFQIGMTATPLIDETRDTYAYFGEPVYTYSLSQGIEDGFLAPYRVSRVVTSIDAVGWRPDKDTVDRFGRFIPDALYETKDFERAVSLLARTNTVARHLTEFLKKTDRFAKTIVFCVDQEHALTMRDALAEFNQDLVREYPDYVCRVTADEGDVGRWHLGNFQDIDRASPVILTTSQMLTTGIDAPTCKNIAIVRMVNSMAEFKQIIGRGTRVREDYGKMWFSILDYTGCATKLFADPSFDGEPIDVAEDLVERETQDGAASRGNPSGDPTEDSSKYYFDGGVVHVVEDMVFELDSSGRQLRQVRYPDYVRERVSMRFGSPEELQECWRDTRKRAEFLAWLAEYGISLEYLTKTLGCRDIDDLDLLLDVVFERPTRTRRQRADVLLDSVALERFPTAARTILRELLEKYVEHGGAQLTDVAVLKVPPISRHGNISEIACIFGGPEHLRDALDWLQEELYRR